MRVLFVTTSYPAHSGDPRGIHIHRLARSLVDEGIEIRVVAPGPPQDALTVLEGVDVDRRDYWFKRGRRLAEGLGGIMPNMKDRPWLAAQVPPLLGALLRGIRANVHWADLIHAHWLYPAGILATYAAGDLPLVVTSHGGDVNRVGNRGPTRWAVNRVLNRSHQILAVSRALATTLTEIGADPAKVRFQPLGVELEFADPGAIDWPTRPGDLKLAFVGSLIERKSPLTIVDAARVLQERGIAVTVAFCGDGPLRERIREQCRSRGVAAVLPGNVAPASVRRWLEAADVFVLPSISEGRPVAVMEAMAAARPVVASDIAGVRELVSPQSGALVEPADAPGFADAIQRFADAAHRQSAGEAGRDRIVELGLTTQLVARAHIAGYRELLERAAA